MAGQPHRTARLSRLGERGQPTAVLDEIVGRSDDGPVALGEPVADLIERPQLDPGAVERLAERW